MEAAPDLRAWKDALTDLGVLGLVPEPGFVVDAVSEVAPVSVREPVPTAPQPTQPLPPRPMAARPESPRAVPSQLLAPPAAAPQSTDPRHIPDPAVVTASTSLEALQECIKDCRACPLGGGRLRLVFGEGHAKAGMMFIGEGPGRDEDLQGRPFVGKAGELLEKMISAIGLSRQEVYIANVVKCRPPDNRTPLPDEAAKCLPFLRRQIELIQPKVIVTLGATPLRELLGINTGITRIRGQWQRLEAMGGIPVMPTFHPAYVLRQYTQDVRRAVWEDLKAAKTWMDTNG